ncbi:LCP family protein [Pseudarthrobacter sp. J75]|uniref:LCP family protein n=1 Tax=unclassified Pseudarthrobacter TaxID=2647000 RepID=UPI002E80157B|nr:MULTISPECIES: LCP family protein [unclassified Pseudarthrobacter]MEE2522139.1 LCP family protein [Pseudarthrobacter sp. J47]MEE2528215.1 LCP family protein [Pseudarthrobacter sp. J75]
MSLPPILENSFDEPSVPEPPRKRRKGRTALIVIGCLVLVAALVAGGYVFNLANTFDSNTDKIEQAFPEESNRPKPAEPVNGTSAKNILLMGSDSRGATEVDAANGAATDQRADTLMLLHIPADRKNVYTVSLMRDLWVDIPGHGQSKINSALAYGGVPLMVQTVESLFNQRIDHVAMVDFEGFKGLTDALGGVEVTSSIGFTSGHAEGYQFKAGPNLLNGEQALAFVRERYAFADGDYQRVRNQQAFLKAIIGKTISAETLTNPVTINNMVQSMAPFVSVDRTLNSGALASLGLELKDIRQQDIAMFTLPTNGIGTSSDGQSIVLPNPEAIANISNAMASDTLGDYITSNNFQNGN